MNQNTVLETYRGFEIVETAMGFAALSAWDDYKHVLHARTREEARAEVWKWWERVMEQRFLEVK